jgi:hypothetical protein
VVVPFLFVLIIILQWILLSNLILNQKSEEKSINSNDINLYTALSMFVSAAPRYIDGILDAAESENLTQIEELAAKLSACSNRVQLTGFTEKAKDLIVAARERRPAVVRSLANGLKQTFEQMINSVDSTGLEQRLKLEEASISVA